MTDLPDAPSAGEQAAAGPPPAAPTPTRRIVTVRNTRALRTGWVLVGIGVVALVAGAALSTASQAWQLATADGRARVGNPVTFDAGEGATYAITLIPDPPAGEFVEDRIQQLGCEVVHPGGDVEEVDAASAEIRTSTSVGIFATDFEGRGGPTTVTCRWTGPSDLASSYTVAESHRATRYVGTGALVGGLLLALIGVGVVLKGYRGRPEIQDLTDLHPEDAPRSG